MLKKTFQGLLSISVYHLSAIAQFYKRWSIVSELKFWSQSKFPRSKFPPHIGRYIIIVYGFPL